LNEGLRRLSQGGAALTPFNYYAMTTTKDHKYSLRLQLVQYARTHGIRPAARAFATTPNTVRRWRARFDAGGRTSLQDRSRRPKTCPHQTSRYQEAKILSARQKVPCFGPRRLRDLCGIRASASAIARILRQKGLSGRRRKKHQRKNDLRAIKAKYNCFQRIQADTKPLFDIPAFWPQMKSLGLPRHQYTQRDVKSGALFIAYANELSTTYATMTSLRLLTHLKKHQVNLRRAILSTDNGIEYGGHDKYERERGFHARIQQAGITHRFLPPATPNAHADVESSHASIEQEFFDLEPFTSRQDFFRKVTIYQHWWNFARPNYSKGAKTPAQLLEEEGLDPSTLLLPPVDIDTWFRTTKHTPQVVSHLPVDAENGGRPTAGSRVFLSCM
jgi:transposase